MTYPPNPYPPGPPPGGSLPARRSHPFRAPLVALAVIVALAVAIAVVFAFTARTIVTDATDVSAGDCVRVTTTGEATVKARTADCDSDEFTFYVASRSSQSGVRCATNDYSRISFEGGGVLCLAPNWRAGHCYEVPRASDPDATYRERGCATPSSDSDHPILEITKRLDGTADPECAASEASVSFALPRPVGYCYAPASDIPA
ncbi:LppU/SCO3897 family protein [Williamsia maris]|uniref:Pyridine nucleotide-disulfide oxidoreductase n=1 Tax=Williamsia maris TaxID=72806 RepID=A0ABT1HDE1_9NOCA|nr:hypothetical protein [Williamsia maris]MCP2174901.1 hypothetical protein [Williamsia maris]